MNKRQAKRLFNVAKATIETNNPDGFTMETYVDDWCGAPQCAIGNYSARRDLQRNFEIVRVRTKPTSIPDSYYDSDSAPQRKTSFAVRFTPPNRKRGVILDCDFSVMKDYFGVTGVEAEKLFGPWGCNNAKTPNAVYKYITKFLTKRGYDPQTHFL